MVDVRVLRKVKLDDGLPRLKCAREEEGDSARKQAHALRLYF